MMARIAADGLVAFHFAFILFVLFGGTLVRNWPRVAFAHIPCALWGIFIELRGWICPLTPLENHLRAAAGGAGYSGGFVDHYVMPLVYPPGLTRGGQVILGGVVVALNLTIYGLLLARRK